MHSLILLLFLTTCLLAPVLGGWQLTFSDEFNNQKKVNTKAWNVFYDFSPTIINQEWEFYSPDAFTFLDDSTLRIIAENRPWYTYQLNYTSGVITTLNKFSQAYGYFELKTRLPAGVGFWPAFWLLPSSASLPLEIDIFEILEQAPTTVYTTYHCDYTPNNANNKGSSANVTALSDGAFHTYGLQWIPGTLIWYVDNQEIWKLSNPCVPNTPEFILVNMAIGGTWPKPPDKTTKFPSYMDVDYVRAYKQLGSGQGTTLPGQVGEGIAFTPPKIDAPETSFSVGLVTANPETVVGSGSSLEIDLTITCNNGTWTGMMLQLVLYPYTLSPIEKDAIATDTLTGLALSGGNTYTYKFSFTIPGGTKNGYYRGALGIFQSNWVNAGWHGAVVMIGVGAENIVGAKTM